MKITTFNPLIVSKDAEATVKVFEALGFERRHEKKGINGEDITDTRMKYTSEDGKVFYVDVAQAPVPQDLTTIRMNVDNFEEAYEKLEQKGFKNTQGDRITETSSSKDTMMESPNGYSITISQHIKEHD